MRLRPFSAGGVVLLSLAGSVNGQDLSALRRDLSQLNTISMDHGYFPHSRPIRVAATIRTIRTLADQSRRLDALLQSLNGDLDPAKGNRATLDLKAHRELLAGQLRAILATTPPKQPVPAAALAEINQLNALIGLIDGDLHEARQQERVVLRAIPSLRNAQHHCQELDRIATTQTERLEWATVVFTALDRMLMFPRAWNDWGSFRR